jgi:hypothetical protein
VRHSHPILAKLSGGDRRSIGRSDEVAREIAESAALFAVVVDAMRADDAVIRMRAADAVEKASRSVPARLQRHKARLLREFAVAEQKEVRWHLAQIVPRLQLSAAERHDVIQVLWKFLNDPSKIVQVNAMQAAAPVEPSIAVKPAAGLSGRPARATR